MCMKHPAYAIFLKFWWLIHSKYDDRYLPQPGHPVHAGHPGYPVPVIQWVLQGQVYHCFVFFASLVFFIASWYFAIFNKCLRWITIKPKSVTKVLANIWLLATPCCIIWSDPFYLHSRQRRLFTISMLNFNPKKFPVLHLVLNKVNALRISPQSMVSHSSQI